MKIRLDHRKLARHLARSNITQNRWAQKLGVSSGHLSMLVNGRRPYPSARIRQKLLDGLGLDFDDLFELEQPPANRPLRPPDPSSVPTQITGMEKKMSQLWNDLRFAFRQYWRRPGFSLVVVLTLGLGIGSVTAVFTVVHGVLLSPLPFPEPERIITIRQIDHQAGGALDEVSPDNFFDFKERSLAFEKLAAAQPYGYDYVEEAEPIEFEASRVTPEYFEALGVKPFRGRLFEESEFQPGNHQVALLSYGIWQRQFGGAELVGETLSLDGQPFQVVGILPSEFRFPAETEIWSPWPLPSGPLNQRSSTYLTVVGRLAPGITLEQARADMEGVFQQLSEEYPAANAAMGISLTPLADHLVERARPALWVFFGAVVLVLLIVCSNLGGLLLSRNLARVREFGIRAAMGASMSRLLRQLAVESVFLSMLGVLAGLLLARWGASLLMILLGDDLPRQAEVGFNLPIFGFAVLVGLAASLLFGLVPSMRLGSGLENYLRGGRTVSPARFHQRFRKGFVIVQLALALVLCVSATLLLQSFQNLIRVDPGFRQENVVAAQIFTYGDPSRRQGLYNRILERLESVPGVEAAGGVLTLPFTTESIEMDPAFTIEGRPPVDDKNKPIALLSAATGNYFRVMGIPLRKGRFFESLDHGEAPRVCLINESMANRFWPADDPVGDWINLEYGRGIRAQVVGVVGDVRRFSLAREAAPEVFLHYPQAPMLNWSISFVSRTTLPPESVIPMVKQAIYQSGYQRPIDMVAALPDLIHNSVSQERSISALITVFSLAALLLAALGIHGLLASAVQQRNREFGIRMALSARPSQILGLVLREGVSLIAIGIALGLLATYWISQILSVFLFGIDPHNPTAYLAAGAVLVVTALVAIYLPARRVLKIDPAKVLRVEN